MIHNHPDFEHAEILDLGENPLPLWDEGVWKSDERWKDILKPLKEKITRADAYVIVVPEWNGAATPAVKNLALFFGERETGHKPVWLISVSSGINGQYPVTDMRANVYKNNKWIFIPDHTVIRFVTGKLNGSEPADDDEKLLRERMQYSLNQLVLYAKALKQVRNKIEFDDRFKYAM
jgi:NAD(P)H-dependent FMN reductase